MTISSSLAAGVAGLNANAARLATISDNIANSATYGYKRSEVDFSALVVSNVASTYSAGGVRTSAVRLIDERGPLVTTGNPTDLAVSGRGMLPVTTASAVNLGNENLPLQLMTTGSFRPDANGILTSETGHVLMGWPANVDGTIPPYPRDTIAGLEPVQVTVNQFAGDPTTEMEIAVNLPATSTLTGTQVVAEELSLEYFGNTGTSELLTVAFTPNVAVGTGATLNPDNTISGGSGVGQSNLWTMVIRDEASNNDIVGNYTLQFDDTRNAGGSLAVVAEGVLQDGSTLASAYDETTGNFTVATASGDVTINIGQIGDSSGLTQLSDNFAPVQINKNGSPVGNLTSVEVDANGIVSAIYDIGFTRTIYQIPVVDVPNPNGLIALSSQTYQASPESGSFFLWDAGDGPWGEVISYAREESATDVAAELTQLIQTQRAYSSNAKVIQTVDEMLQETTNIKR